MGDVGVKAWMHAEDDEIGPFPLHLAMRLQRPALAPRPPQRRTWVNPLTSPRQLSARPSSAPRPAPHHSGTRHLVPPARAVSPPGADLALPSFSGLSGVPDARGLGGVFGFPDLPAPHEQSSDALDKLQTAWTAFVQSLQVGWIDGNLGWGNTATREIK